ncbi:MAG: hypothetical protein U1F76_08445 [Candidatus Competibacteraceae bacterium]
MNKQHSIENHPWRKTPLALAILAALQGAAVQEAFATGVVPAGPPPNPVGPEFQASTYNGGNYPSPTVAMDAHGDFVVTWQGVDNDSLGILAQRYNAAGVAQGSEFQVNTTITSTQGQPAVAMDAAGDFVIAWGSYGLDGSQWNIYAQRYNAAGEPQGDEFQVNTYTTNDQFDPAVAMDAAGDFVVVWQSGYGQDGDSFGVYAQRYNATGVPQGDEFQVNTYTTNGQFAPAVAMDAAGDFVVAWQSAGQDGTALVVYAQRYDKTGVPQGSEFRVSPESLGLDNYSPAVAMDAAGDFVVTWENQVWASSEPEGIYARRYNAVGEPQSAFLVNTYPLTGHPVFPAVAMDAAGDFVVTWHNYEDGNGWSIYAQRYNAAGAPQGSEFRVNTNTLNQSYLDLAVAMDAVGDFVITWQRITQDGTNWVASAQRYAPNKYNTAFSTPVLSNQRTDRTAVPEGPAGTFSFDATFCHNDNPLYLYPLTGLVSQTVILTNGNCLINRLYGPAGTPPLTPGAPPCGAGSALDFPVIGNYSDYALAVGECVTVHYQIGLQNRKRFSFFVDVGGI